MSSVLEPKVYGRPDAVRVFEVGPRDGLQNESAILPVSQRVELIHRLVAAGARDVEIGSFVHPKWIPQLADTEEVARQIERVEGVNYWALVPNVKGLERALASDVKHLAVFISASETHNHKNLNRSVSESLEQLKEVFAASEEHDLTIRAYISMVFGCPYEGEIPFGRVMEMTETLFELGADYISLGDTIGIGTPLQVRHHCGQIIQRFGPERIALHLHDTRGMGVTNAMVALEVGMQCFDSAVGGIGGCPYAPGAAGNLGSEDLVYLLDSLGVRSGLSIEKLSETALWLEEIAGIETPSRCSSYLHSARRDV